MRTAVELISKLRALGVRVSTKEGRLRLDGPKGALTPEIKQALRENKDHILEFLASQSSRTVEPISVRDHTQPHFPLSFSQERLWFLDHFSDSGAAYNLPFSVRLRGELDTQRLAAAFAAMIQRHESMRTSFGDHEGEPHQIIHQEVPFQLKITTDTSLDAFLQATSQQGFDLSLAPLFRAELLVMGEQDHVLTVVFHHIISDAWSFGVFIKELLTFYQAGVTQPSLPELKIQYADYSLWSKQRLSGEHRTNQEDFWREYLLDAPAHIELPTDRPRPQDQGFDGDRIPLRFPLPNGARALAQRNKATMFMLVETVFALLLHRYGGQEDVVVGTPVANRNHPDLEGLIGFFVNTLALRNSFSQQQSFSDLLSANRESITRAFAHQEYPFEALVDLLVPERTTAYQPIIQVVFSWENGGGTQASPEGLEVERLVAEDTSAKFELTLILGEEGDDLVGELEFNTDLFDRKTIERWGNHLVNLFRDAVQRPHIPIGKLHMLDEAEVRDLVQPALKPTTNLDPVTCFYRQAAQKPEAIAYFEDSVTQVTYAALADRISGLASALRKHGVGPEQCVAIFAERDTDVLAAMMAVLTCGAHFVVLDPDLPVKRLEYMVAQTCPQLVLAAEETDVPLSLTRIPLDASWEKCDFHATEPYPQALAYVVFTSGTTGRPKGVAVSREALSLHMTSALSTFELKEGDRVLRMARSAFDVALEECFPTLAAGATLMCYRGSRNGLMARFNEVVVKDRLTVLNLPAAFWHEWVVGFKEEEPPNLDNVRLVVVGSEAVQRERLTEWQEHYSEIRWINAYGPSEGTITATSFQPHEATLLDQVVPVGSPWPHVETLVASGQFQLAPIGVDGELLLGGGSLARGYLGRPALTAEKFIPHPNSNQPGARLYRTGDRVRWIAGTTHKVLAFRGRVDHQIKLRGLRIEPQEIARVIGEYPQVRQSHVLLVGEGDARRLAGFYQTRETTSAGTGLEDGLRHHLSEHLPQFMRPAELIQVENWPKTSTDKLDIKALAKMVDPSNQLVAEQKRPPGSPLEQDIHDIWCEALGREKIGVDQDFFAVGGHSLLAIRVLARIKKRLRRELSPEQFFKTPTIMGQAKLLAPPSAADAAKLIASWNQTALDYPRDQNLADLFAAVASQRPDEVALVADDRSASLTYAELAHKGKHIAHLLRECGVTPEEAVGLMVSRELEMVAAMLGIYWSGACCLPLDPEYPQDRLEYMVRDGAVRLLIHGSDFDLSENAFEITPLLIPSTAPDQVPEPKGLLAANLIANIMYTSGSTGQPKGVCIPHRAAVRLAKNNFIEYKPNRVWAQLAPISFDASTFEIWGCLLEGSRLVVSSTKRPTLDALDFLAEHEVEVIFLTTGLFSLLMGQRYALPESLKILVTGGDVLPLEAARALRRRYPMVQLVNGYGPTENGTFTTCHSVAEVGEEAVSIGGPIANTHVYIHDPALLLVSPGVGGALATGGDGVARGYLGQPAKTAAVFVPDPFASEPGARLYLTGDRCAWGDDGKIHFYGRTDRQLKIRGFRIEPGEVEKALERLPGVTHSYVAGYTPPDQPKLLAAWIEVPDGGLDQKSVREKLASELPTYLVPDQIMVMDQFPLTVNGKLDRKGLPEPHFQRTGELTEPRNETEATLHGIWLKLLGIKQAGVYDDFFEMGGHSLSAMRLASKVRSVFRVDIPVKVVFDVPTIAALAEWIDAAERLSESDLGQDSSDNRHPLSWSQQRFLFIDRLEPGSPAYNIPSPMQLTGPLVVSLLEDCFTSLINRHPALRTVFGDYEYEAVQIISKESDFRLGTVDLRNHPDPESAARQLAQQEARTPFNLTTGPLMRAMLLRLDTEQHVLLLNMHHIISDGWSMTILVQEMQHLYMDALLRQDSKPSAEILPVLTHSYVDYAHHQRARLSGKLLKQGVDFWRRRLEPCPPYTDLPLDKPRPTDQTFSGSAHGIELSPELSAELDRFAATQGVTPFMLTLTIFQILLARYSNQDHVVVGSPIAGRTEEAWEGLIGCFVNTLALSAGMRDEKGQMRTGTNLLAQTRTDLLEAYAQSDIPFEKLVEELQPVRDLSRNPIFQVMFSFLNLPEAQNDETSIKLQVKPLNIKASATHFDLTLMIAPPGPSTPFYTGSINYNRILFESATIERMAEHYQALVCAFLDAPDRSVDAMPFLTVTEKAALIDTWYLPDLTAQPTDITAPLAATRADDEVVLIHRHADGGTEVTRSWLDRRADGIAHQLRNLGVGQESRVAVCAERTPDLPAALLGIMRTGAAYVPLDPKYPLERSQFIIADAQAHVLIGDHTAEALKQDDLPFIDLTIAAETHPNNRRSHTRPEPGSAAYVIYTSGSTGKPKGVVITHGNVGALLAWAASYFPQEALGHVLAGTSICFDLSVFELFLPLFHGGRVVLASDIMALENQLAEVPVTLINTVPSAMRELLSLDVLPATLQIINLAGEPLERRLLDDIHASNPKVRVFNLYGPSEDTTYSTGGEMPPKHEPHLGRPLPGTQAYLIDAQLYQVPVGITGELCLSGEGLSRGYLNRPALTAEKFVPNPFATTPGQRLYKTGDLARFRAIDALPGELMFQGRIDYQVKVRGFRIELDEIVNVLLEVDLVVAAAVLPMGSGHHTQLVAFVQSHPDAQEDHQGVLDALLAHSAQKLPHYMVPNRIQVLNQLPLTPNGKIDRKALPALLRKGERKVGKEPRDHIELELAKIWEELLDQEQVFIEDDFFAIGGHSLSAMRMVSKMRTAFRVDLPVKTIFEAPTIAALAERIKAAEAVDEEFSQTRDASQNKHPLSWPQQRFLFIDRLDPGSSAYNLPTPMQMNGPLDLPLLEACFTCLFNRHDSLRTVFGDHEGEAVQIITPKRRYVLNMIDLCDHEDPETVTTQLAKQEMKRPFTLAKGPLMRTTLLRLNPERHVLLINMHHIISDGWSTTVFVQEMQWLYQDAMLRGDLRPTEQVLPRLTHTYADYAHRQQIRQERGLLDKGVAFWRNRLEQCPPYTDMPLDKPRPARQTFNGNAYSFYMTSELTEAVEQFCSEKGVTAFMLTLTVFQILLARYSNQDHVVVGSPTAGRDGDEWEGLIGCFVNTLALSAGMRDEAGLVRTGSDLLNLTREGLLDAYAHNDIPFDKLVEELQPERDLSRNPIFQIMFSFFNVPDTKRDGTKSKLQVSPLPVKATATHFDLTLTITPPGAASPTFTGDINYNQDLFEATTIMRLADHYRILLRAFLDHPELPVDTLPFITALEKTALLDSWQQPALDQQVTDLTRPLASIGSADDVALIHKTVDGDTAVTRSWLDQRADGIAQQLRALGVGPESRVAVCAERTPSLPAAMLGIMRTGAAYVPLDPKYPLERSQFIIADAEAHVLIGDHTAAPLKQDGLSFIDLTVSYEHASAPTRKPEPTNAAYVIYTSGSTGKPKGVVITHGNAGALLTWAASYFPPETRDHVLAGTSICFDLSVFELFLPLFHQGRVVLVEDVLALGDQLVTAPVSLINTVPSAMRELLSLNALPASLQCINLAGEPLERRLLDDIYAQKPKVRVFNLYGPSEDTTYSTGGEMPPNREPHLGRPIPGTQAYLTDPRLRTVAVGMMGELCLAGEGLSRGYLNRPAMTAEKFVPNPFATTPGQRLYKTGDLTRFRAKEALPGELMFLGRVDHQVKVRGFRIELDEIVNTLLEVDGVVGAAVLPIGKERNTHLAAFVQSHPEAEDHAPIKAAVLEHTAQKLPDYMVPKRIKVLDQLPLTPNGKIDRKALPQLLREDARQTGKEPRDHIELELSQIWAEIFGLERVYIDDDFFALGGHSLLSVRLMGRIKTALGVDLPVATLFQSRTIAAQAVLLRAQLSGQSDTNTTLLTLSRTKAPSLYLVHPVGGTVMSFAPLAATLEGKRTIQAFEAPALHGQESLETIEAMAEAYLDLLQDTGKPIELGGWSMGGLVAYEMACRLQARGQTPKQLILFDTWAINPGTGEIDTQIDPALLAAYHFLTDLERISGRSLDLDYHALSQMDEKEGLATAFRRVTQLGLVPAESGEETLQRLFRVFQTNTLAMDCYTPPAYTGPITLFRPETEHFPNKDRGWQQFATNLQEIQVPGDHYTMLQKPKKLTQSLANILTS